MSYEARRNDLIPAAERVARQAMEDKRLKGKEAYSKEFIRAMVILAAQAGLTSPATVKLFHDNEIKYKQADIDYFKDLNNARRGKK